MLRSHPLCFDFRRKLFEYFLLHIANLSIIVIDDLKSDTEGNTKLWKIISLSVSWSSVFIERINYY